MSYRFRLSAVQRLRESHRDDARLRLAEANQAADKLVDEYQRLRALLEEARRARAAETSAAEPDANRLIDAQRYESILAGQLADLAEKQRLINEEIARRRDALANADREVRVLQLLDERGQQEYRRAEAAVEQRRQDEVASIVWRRNQTTTTPPRSS